MKEHRIYSDENIVTRENFQHPSAEYRGSPFWAWNNELNPEMLAKQVPLFREMGFGGFHMHARPGLNLPYMSKEFLDRVEQCAIAGENLGLLPRLYDEDRWPSGFAGGEVVQGHPELRRRILRFSKTFCEDAHATVARFDVSLNADGTLRSYRLLDEGEKSAYSLWLAQVIVEENSVRYSGSAYIDTLNPKAVERFLELTHERYKERLTNMLGTAVPSIFTDEPRTPVQKMLPDALCGEEAEIPWTDTLPETFRRATGNELIPYLPELIWDLPEKKASHIRWQYYDHVAELFARGFFDTIGTWCRKNGLDFSGHLMDEFPLCASVRSSGEAMRCYRSMDIPGIDMLCNQYEYTTAKQAQSIVRQMDKNGMLSELYGVIGWDGDFRKHKLQGDWQAAMGVTLRVPHLAWCSMRGDRKRDYPQSIFYQSAWYREYPLIENHFARVNLALTQGRPVCRIGVIHPLESLWLHCGPTEQNQKDIDRIEKNWENVTEWLLFGGYDFDFISESMLIPLYSGEGAPLRVGKEHYDVVVIPECETLRRSTMECLRKFRNAGGTIVFAGEIPAMVDAIPSAAPTDLANTCVRIPLEKSEMRSALRPFRDIRIQNMDGSCTEEYLYQMREDANGRWLFLACGKAQGDEETPKDICLTIPGSWKAELYDTISGETQLLFPEYEGNKTKIVRTVYAQDSLLVRLTPGREEQKCPVEKERVCQAVSLPEEYQYTLSEPNVLLLDVAEYRLDEEPWQRAEEIRRLDRGCRRKLDWHGGIQPWLIPDEAPIHKISLRFRITSQVRQEKIRLALENAQKADILWNGKAVSHETAGFYVDWEIPTVVLPPLEKGENLLEVTLPFEKKETVEWCYLLGNFGVSISEDQKILVPLPEKLKFGSIVPQGFPFYGGTVTYHIPFCAESAGTLAVQLPEYHAAVVKAQVDNGNAHTIAFAPYICRIPTTAGKHMLELTAFLNRTNSFAPVHNANPNETWFGWTAWETQGEQWTYNYVLQPEGIVATPILKLEQGDTP